MISWRHFPLSQIFTRHTGWILVSAVMICTGCRTQLPYLRSAPSQLPYVTSMMATPGFWINRLQQPDKIILSQEEITRLNESIVGDQGLVRDLSAWPDSYQGSLVRKQINEIIKHLQSKHLMKLDGSPITSSQWDYFTTQMDVNTIPENVARQYALTTEYAHQRLLPTEEAMYATAGDIDFDELQNSALDIGTPVLVLHKSQDGEWVYVQTALSAGWIKTTEIVKVDAAMMREWADSQKVIVTDAKADIYMDKDMTHWLGSARMGADFPLKQIHEIAAEILVPVRDRENGSEVLTEGYISLDQIHQGYLPYTQRTVITQAFKMLHEPYGWGGMYGAQDCSRFMEEIFSTVGIQLPRNSSAQIQMGQLLARFDEQATHEEKLKVLNNAGVEGATLLGMRGHIMLYMGMIDNHAYAIHAVWAYRQPGGQNRDDIFVLNRVTLSDLSLGDGSLRGSLLTRLNAIRFLGKQNEK